jgi:hypothetical protein
LTDPFHLIHLEADPGGGGDGGGDPDPGDPTPPEPQEGTPGPQDDPKDEEIKGLRKESGKYRTELRKAQAKIEELEAKDKTELERAQEGNVKAKERADSLAERNRLLTARLIAGDLGVDPDARADAARLLDWDSIEDPEDESQVEEALRDLVDKRPYLLGRTAGGADAGAGRTRQSGQGGDSMNDLIRAGAGRA